MTPSEMLQIGQRAEQLLTTLPEEFADAAVELGLARLYCVKDDTARSEAAARRVLALESTGTEQRAGALPIVATACFDRRQFSEAADFFAELTRLRRNSEDWYYLGVCAHELRQFKTAIRALETSRTINPDAPEPCLLLAEIYRVASEPEAEQRVLDDLQRLTQWGRSVNKAR